MYRIPLGSDSKHRLINARGCGWHSIFCEGLGTDDGDDDGGNEDGDADNDDDD